MLLASQIILLLPLVALIAVLDNDKYDYIQ